MISKVPADIEGTNWLSQAVCRNRIEFLFGLAIVFPVLRLCKGNIWICIGCHAMYDWAVSFLIEMRLLHSKESFWSLIGLITKWRRTEGLVIGCAAVVIMVVFCHSISKEKKL